MLQIWIVPNIRESPRAKVAFKDTRHVHIKQRLRRAVAKEHYRVRDVLADTRQRLDLNAALWEATLSQRHLVRELLEGRSSSPPKAEGAKKLSKFLLSCTG